MDIFRTEIALRTGLQLLIATLSTIDPHGTGYLVTLRTNDNKRIQVAVHHDRQDELVDFKTDQELALVGRNLLTNGCPNHWVEYGPYNDHTALFPIKDTLEIRASWRFSDLFCGLGAWTRVWTQLGGIGRIAADFFPPAIEAYNLLRAQGNDATVERTLCDDVTKPSLWHLFDADVISASPPCQPFSGAGLQAGLSSPEAKPLLMLFVMLACLFPPVLVGEEVAALVDIENGEAWAYILNLAAIAGFKAAWKVINSKHVTPQKRRRLYFVFVNASLPNADRAVKTIQACLDSFPFELQGPSLRAFGAIQPVNYLTSQELMVKLTENQLRIMRDPHLMPYSNFKRFIYPTDQIAPILRSLGLIEHFEHTGNVQGQVIVVDDNLRLPTARELFKIFGFPACWMPENPKLDPAQNQWFWRPLCGNSVSVPIVIYVGASALLGPGIPIRDPLVYMYEAIHKCKHHEVWRVGIPMPLVPPRSDTPYFNPWNQTYADTQPEPDSDLSNSCIRQPEIAFKATQRMISQPILCTAGASSVVPTVPDKVKACRICTTQITAPLMACSYCNQGACAKCLQGRDDQNWPVCNTCIHNEPPEVIVSVECLIGICACNPQLQHGNYRSPNLNYALEWLFSELDMPSLQFVCDNQVLPNRQPPEPVNHNLEHTQLIWTSKFINVVDIAGVRHDIAVYMDMPCCAFYAYLAAFMHLPCKRFGFTIQGNTSHEKRERLCEVMREEDSVTMYGRLSGGVPFGWSSWKGVEHDDWDKSDPWSEDWTTDTGSSSSNQTQKWKRDNKRAWEGRQKQEQPWSQVAFTAQYKAEDNSVHAIKAWDDFSAGETGVFAIERHEIQGAIAIVKDNPKVAFVLGGDFVHVQRFLYNKRILDNSKHMIQRIPIPYKDGDFERFKDGVMMHIVKDGKCFYAPTAKEPEVPSTQPTTIEVYVQAHASLQRYPELKAGVWKSELEKLTTYKPLEVFNLRAQGKSDYVTATVRFHVSIKVELLTKSGMHQVHFREIIRGTQQRDALGLVWIKGVTSDEAYLKGQSLTGFRGTIPSSSNDAFGLRFDPSMIADARKQLCMLDGKFTESNSGVVGELGYETSGWNPTADAPQVMEVMRAWGWNIIVSTKRIRRNITTFDVRASDAPPASRLYTDAAETGFVLIYPKFGQQSAKVDKETVSGAGRPYVTMPRTAPPGVSQDVEDKMKARHDELSKQTLQDLTVHLEKKQAEQQRAFATALKQEIEAAVTANTQAMQSQVDGLKTSVQQVADAATATKQEHRTALDNLDTKMDEMSDKSDKQFRELMKAINGKAASTGSTGCTPPSKKPNTST